MSDPVAFLGLYAPFLTANWPYLLPVGTLIIGFVIARALSGRKVRTGPPVRATSLRNGSVQVRERGEHPMSEFENDANAIEEESPSLHSADTPQVVYPFERLSKQEMVRRSEGFYVTMNKRRSVRDFSPDPVPIEVIHSIIKTAGTCPSGAHTEPWTFVVVADKEIKAKIREIIEQEEYLNYDHRMGDKWVKDLRFLGTTNEKLYLETAPYIIIVFKQPNHVDKKGIHHQHYYFEISTAMACGMLVTAIHNAGLVTVTTTPLNAGGALRELLGRPNNEKVMLLLPVGYPAENAKVPNVRRKNLEDIMVVV